MRVRLATKTHLLPPSPSPDDQTPLAATREVIKDLKKTKTEVVEVLYGMYTACDSPPPARGVIGLYDPPPNPWPLRLGRVNFVKDLMNDVKKRKACYGHDWRTAFKNRSQVIPAILFLYFACLSPVVSFGTIAAQLTGGGWA